MYWKPKYLRIHVLQVTSYRVTHWMTHQLPPLDNWHIYLVSCFFIFCFLFFWGGGVLNHLSKQLICWYVDMIIGLVQLFLERYLYLLGWFSCFLGDIYIYWAGVVFGWFSCFWRDIYNYWTGLAGSVVFGEISFLRYMYM